MPIKKFNLKNSNFYFCLFCLYCFTFNIYQCENSSPQNKKIRREWLFIIGTDKSPNSRVCSDHFAEKQIKYKILKTKSKKFKDDADTLIERFIILRSIPTVQKQVRRDNCERLSSVKLDSYQGKEYLSVETSKQSEVEKKCFEEKTFQKTIYFSNEVKESYSMTNLRENFFQEKTDREIPIIDLKEKNFFNNINNITPSNSIEYESPRIFDR